VVRGFAKWRSEVGGGLLRFHAGGRRRQALMRYSGADLRTSRTYCSWPRVSVAAPPISRFGTCRATPTPPLTRPSDSC